MKIKLKTVALLFAATTVASLPAQAIVVTFNGLTGGTVAPNGAISYASPLVSDGYIFTTLPFFDGRPGEFATWTTASDANATFSNHTGPISIFSNSGRPTTMMASNGVPFNVSSLSLGYVFRGGAVITVNLSGALVGGGSVTQTFVTAAGDSALRTVTLIGFAGLSAFTIAQSGGNEAFQFNNINVQAVPETSTALMLSLGLVTLIVVRRKA